MMQAKGYSNSELGKKVSEEDHVRLVQWFEDSEELSHDGRQLSHRSRDYYDSKQLTAAELEKLRKRGQPPTVINRIAPKVNFLLGLEASNRTDPRAFPRNPKDEGDAEAATDSLRYVEKRENLDNLFSLCYEDMLIEGTCALEITCIDSKQEDDGDKEIQINLWRFDRLFWDPFSSRHDFSDARYKGGFVWMDRDQVVAMYPHAEELMMDQINEANQPGYDDKPSWHKWSTGSRGRERVRIVQIWWKAGKQWKWAIYTKGGVLDGGDVPYVDANGDSECPIEMQSTFIDRENQRYGIIRAMLDLQDEINKRRSKALHLLNVRQVRIQDGAVDDENKLSEDLAKPDAVIVTNPGFEFEILQTGDLANGQVQLLQEAKAELDEMGANNALRGQTGRSSSGRAIIASQQGGQMEIGVVQDRHRAFKLRVYRQIWNRIRQYWTAERWIRVTDNEKNVKFVQLNEPITVFDQMIEQKFGPDHDPNNPEVQQFEQQLIQQAPPEELQRVVGKKRNPATLDVDIILDVAPDTVIIQQEQFEELVKLLQTNMPLEDPRMRLLIQASNLRNKKELLESIDERAQQAQQQGGPDPLAIERMQAENAELRAKVDKLIADTDKIRAETVKVEIETGQSSERHDVDLSTAAGFTGVPDQPPPGMTGV